jgi:Xaa-Pro aminopeptidase
MIHGTGHGVGLEVHEAPRISDIEMELRPGDVITIEPGLYSEAEGGVRIEDTVLVTADGYRNLTDYPKGWKP